MSKLGVVIVTFNSTDVIADCLETLISVGADVPMKIVVVDNASSDGTVELIQNWASGAMPYAADPPMPFETQPVAKPVAITFIAQEELGPVDDLTLISAKSNGGFAGGVNIGLAHLAQDPAVGHLWVLNPDTVVPSGTPAAILAQGDAQPDYALMGGRVNYFEWPDLIQIDGGVVNWKTGVSGNIGVRQVSQDTPAPKPSDMTFITGASMIASRRFYEMAGPMAEDYFLYYEEVDWALQRKDLPLTYCADAIVYHKAGTSIGSQSLNRKASPFSLFFKHRSRMMFMRRHTKGLHFWAYAYTFAKSAQLAVKGDFSGAVAILRGTFNLQPPKEVTERLSPEAKKIAFGS